MKLACQEALVPGRRFGEKLAWLERSGFAGIELSGHDIGLRINDIQAALAGSSVKLSAMHGGYGVTPNHPDPELAEQTRQHLQGLLKYCALLDCPGLIIGSYYRAVRSGGVGKAPGPASEDDIDRMSLALDGLSAAAEEYGVLLYLEPLNRYESDLIHTIDDAVRVCERVGRSSLQVAAATFHMNLEEESLTVPLARHSRRVGYVHVSDSNRRGPGQGHLPFHEFAIVHRQLGYTGYLSLEGTIEGEEELLKAKRYLERL